MVVGRDDRHICKSPWRHQDLKLDLGVVVEQFKVTVQEKKIYMNYVPVAGVAYMFSVFR